MDATTKGMTMTREQELDRADRNGWDTTLARQIVKVGDDRAKRITADLKRRGLKGTALLDALQLAIS